MDVKGMTFKVLAPIINAILQNVISTFQISEYDKAFTDHKCHFAIPQASVFMMLLITFFIERFFIKLIA